MKIKILISVLFFLGELPAQLQECNQPKVWRTNKGEETQLSFQTPSGEQNVDLLELNPYDFKGIASSKIDEIYNTPIYEVSQLQEATSLLARVFGNQPWSSVLRIKSQVSVGTKEDCFTTVIFGVYGCNDDAKVGFDNVVAFSTTIFVFDNMTGEIISKIENNETGVTHPEISPDGRYMICRDFQLEDMPDEHHLSIYDVQKRAVIYKLSYRSESRSISATALPNNPEMFIVRLKRRASNGEILEIENHIIDAEKGLCYTLIMDKALLNKKRRFVKGGIRLSSSTNTEDTQL